MSTDPGTAGRPTFTVFTPTFDRATTLERLRTSLEAQTFRDFEWLIVDDGSSDGTEELVRGWMGTSDLDIGYVRQENAGEHSRSTVACVKPRVSCS